ncbi:MAG: hypothetical protein EPN33_08755 [Acidobacteria bacterium]|nr:MAG: hypothetical protein EPN33_08755 [Acidobacteriota bacterium]
MPVARLLCLLLFVAVPLATLSLGAQTPMSPPSAAAVSARTRPAPRHLHPRHKQEDATGARQQHHRWLITAVIAAAAAIITGIIVAHRDHSQRCQGCVGNFP